MNCFRPLFIAQHACYGILLAIIWLNELLDLPYILGVGPQTPLNISESLIESIALIAVWSTSSVITIKFCRKIRILEGILPTCSSCKKIRNMNDSWEVMESYISNKTEAEFSHSLCPDCLRELYPNIADNILNKMDDAN